MEGDWKLIYYHEDDRYELYNLRNDIGEQKNLMAKESKHASKMRKKLDNWLRETKAKFPMPDPKFNAVKREARWKNIKTSGKERLEKQHASFLSPTYKPNKDWWGSDVEK